MKIVQTEMSGVGIWKLSGIVDEGDAHLLVHAINRSGGFDRGCLVLDFEDVVHVDYKTFELLQKWLAPGAEVLLSGFSDYLLDIYAFAVRDNKMSIFSDWNKALQYLLSERGKLKHRELAASMGSK